MTWEEAKNEILGRAQAGRVSHAVAVHYADRYEYEVRDGANPRLHDKDPEPKGMERII